MQVVLVLWVPCVSRKEWLRDSSNLAREEVGTGKQI